MTVLLPLPFPYSLFASPVPFASMMILSIKGGRPSWAWSSPLWVDFVRLFGLRLADMLLVGGCFALYVLLVRLLRYRRRDSQTSRYGFTAIDSFSRMTVHEAQAIQAEYATLESPQMYFVMSRLGLLKVSFLPECLWNWPVSSHWAHASICLHVVGY